MSKYKAGDTAYIICNGHVVTEVTIKRYSGGFYIVQPAGSSGAIRLKEHRIFRTREDADRQIPGKEVRGPHWWPH